jgi:hypothetical protein
MKAEDRRKTAISAEKEALEDLSCKDDEMRKLGGIDVCLDIEEVLFRH